MAILTATAQAQPTEQELIDAAEAAKFTRGVYIYLVELPQHVLARLYETPSSCLAIFR